MYPFSVVSLPSVPGNSVQFTTCAFGGDYTSTTGTTSGASYTYTSTNSSDYCTVRSGTYNGAVVAFGPVPLTFTASSTADLFFHVTTNSSCGTDGTCRTTGVTYNAVTTYNPCTSVGSLSSCTTTSTTIASGNGAWAFGPYTPAGKEYLYTFTPSTTGTYTITQNSNSTGEYIDYFFKASSGGCNSSGWTFIQDILTTGTSAGFTMTAGTQYYILLDEEWTTAGTVSWTLNCPCIAPTVPTLSATNTTICNGGNSTLSIATGTLNSATTWSWYTGSCGGTAAGTGSTLAVSPTVTTTYYARGTGGCVTPGTCGSITITVNNPPTISVQPAATVTQCEGSTLSLSVTSANGTGYQWYKGVSPLSNGGNISGATSANLQIINTTPAETGVYSVVITAATSCTNLTSANSTVTINPAVAISSQPAATTNVCDGSALNLGATVTNGVSYQWYKGASPVVNGGSISGAGTTNLVINPAIAGDAGTYSLQITANPGCPTPVTTNNAVVNVNARPTATLMVNGAATICDGTPTNIEITFTGTAPWTFDLFDGSTTSNVTTSTNPYSVAVSPSTTSTYSITSLMDANCTSIGSDYSATDMVTVNPRPTATLTNNGPSTICNGSSASVDITLTGTAPFDFDYSDGTTTTNVTGYASNVYTITESPATTTTYSVQVLSDDNCTAQPGDIVSTATVTVEYPPSITTLPSAMTACSGVGTSLTVVAGGSNLAYQWQLNGSPLSDDAIYSGTGTATLGISDITGLGGGLYDVVISGSCPPIITTTQVALTEDFNNSWDGGVSADWSDAMNWSCGTVPIVTTNVLIPNGATNMPMVDIPTAICNSITIDPLATIGFAGANNALEIKAAITNNGVFDATMGKVILSGAGTQNVPPIMFKNLEIDGGSTKTLDGPATVTGILSLISGYLEIGPYDLTIDVPVQILGGSASSFIVTNDTGEVIGKNMGLIGGNPDAAMFHVGVNSGSYTPVMLENMGNADDFSVRVMPNVYEDGYGINPQMVVNPVVNRTWMIDEATAGGSYLNINPYWNTVNEINGFTQTHVYVAHYLGGMWISYEDSANGAPAAGTFGSLFYADVDSIQNFSPFTVASSINTFPFPLAIKLLDISAVNLGDVNLVSWATSTESNGDVFEIQRSVDGKDFTAIGSMNANGKASAYNFRDERPSAGKNFYRLKMMDVNARTGYSNVVSAIVKGAHTPFDVNAYPNPVEGGRLTIVVSGSISGDASVVITDVTGAIVKEVRNLPSNSLDMDVSDLAQGVYFVKYSDDAHHEIIKINKQ